MLTRASLTIRLHPDDDVVIARTQLVGGTRLIDEDVAVTGLVPPAHKVATRAIRKGEPVKRYNQIIGFASRDIAPGEHVHLHNLAMGAFDRDYAFGADARPTQYVDRPATFQGIVRRDGHNAGKVATRNYLGVLSTVNCSATVARAIADQVTRGALARYPNVDGVVALTHGSGCGMDTHGEGMKLLRRTLAGYARHPNFAGVLIVGLGCEANQISSLLGAEQLAEGPLLRTFSIQDTGGTAKTVARGVAMIEEMLPRANDVAREPVAASAIVVGLQCGGSDGYSGITANPALGAAVDVLVRHGGTAILSETPEIYGAEHLLTRRASSPAIGKKLVDRIAWWEEYCARNGAQMNNNPSAGNKAGGLTTVLEKSLGAVAKGGSMPLKAVYEYAEIIEQPGFVFMDTPGYDPVAVTGQVAGGCNVVCFTTGRGSVSGWKPAPTIKIATNTEMFDHMREDMDIDTGGIATGTESIESAGEKIFERILAVASGEKTLSEQLQLLLRAQVAEDNTRSLRSPLGALQVEGAHRHRKSSPRVEIGLLGRERYLTFNGQVQVVVQGPGESTQVLAQQAVGLALQQGAGRRVHEPDDAPPIHGHHAALHLREHLLRAFLLGQYLSPQLSVLGRDRGVSGFRQALPSTTTAAGTASTSGATRARPLSPGRATRTRSRNSHGSSRSSRRERGKSPATPTSATSSRSSTEPRCARAGTCRPAPRTCGCRSRSPWPGRIGSTRSPPPATSRSTTIWSASPTTPAVAAPATRSAGATAGTASAATCCSTSKDLTAWT